MGVRQVSSTNTSASANIKILRRLRFVRSMNFLQPPTLTRPHLRHNGSRWFPSGRGQETSRDISDVHPDDKFAENTRSSRSAGKLRRRERWQRAYADRDIHRSIAK